MQSLSDDERRQVLGEVLADVLKVILEYVKDVPLIKDDLRQVRFRVKKIEDRLVVMEHVLRDHETDLKQIKLRLMMA